MKFTKMHGAGNDFIIINNISGEIPDAKLPDTAKRLCTAHLSIGADGLMVVTAAKHGGDFGMLFFNSDGSMGEMCGNGARCISRWGYENGLAGETQRIETTAGLVTGERISRSLYRVRLNDPQVLERSRCALLPMGEYLCGYAELGCPGIPHAIVNMPDWRSRDRDELRRLGRALRFADCFPRGANVTFAALVGENKIDAITYERGVEDLTLACGTGCGSTVAVFTLAGLVSGENTEITMPGGTLYVNLKCDSGGVHDIFLTGPTALVCVGEFFEEDYITNSKTE